MTKHKAAMDYSMSLGVGFEGLFSTKSTISASFSGEITNEASIEKEIDLQVTTPYTCTE